MQRKYIRLKGQLMDLSRPRVMGIINLTPDSFYTPSRVALENIEKAAEKMVEEGADILDLGAVSTRPGAVMPDEEEEWRRLEPALHKVLSAFPEVPISVDTWRPAIAERALAMGVAMINDISGGRFVEGMPEVLARYQVPGVLMHTTAPPEVMQQRLLAENVTEKVVSFLVSEAGAWERAGVRDVVVDPGIGFGKSEAQNFELLSRLPIFKKFPWPVLIGLSRKKFIRDTLQVSTEEALLGTTALHMAALQGGAAILRVHDVREAVHCVKLFMALSASKEEEGG